MYILPKPQFMEIKNDALLLTHQGRIIIASSCDQEMFQHAQLLKQEMLTSLGYAPEITRGQQEDGSIFLCQEKKLQKEEYTLDITLAGVTICGGSSAGVLYGIQTLRQILMQQGANLPVLTLRDYPDIENRGYYYDATRGRIPTLAYLKSFADKLSFYKINQLQLYIEHSFLFKELNEVWRDDTPLTAEEILELDAYCRKLHIELVPSLSTFGHLYKLLRTKSYESLCELEDSRKEPFSFEDRMSHHTIDTTNEQSLILVKKLIDEFMPLFSSDQFNLCADETFDLGKGKSRETAERLGTDTIYIRYVKELCEYLLSMGKRPMFWGDIICGFPEAIRELPEETICLNWGYAPDQNEDAARSLSEAGATQYLCPGVAGWNQWINLIDASYENIMSMCSYAHKYHALGILNTDWGDYGHINHPEFSMTGMIYGAAFSWNSTIPAKEEINRQISLLEYGDRTESFVALISEFTHHRVFEWYDVVRYRELEGKQKTEEEKKAYLTALDFTITSQANAKLQEGMNQLYRGIIHLDPSKRQLVKPYLIAAEGMLLFNTIGATLQQYRYGLMNLAAEEPTKLADRLEQWFRHYKEGWRSVSKEAELYRVQEVIFWYADLLRDTAK